MEFLDEKLQNAAYLSSDESVEARDITPRDNSETLGMDSLDKVEFVMRLEKAYQISIPDDEVGNCETMEDFQKVVNKYKHTPYES